MRFAEDEVVDSDHDSTGQLKEQDLHHSAGSDGPARRLMHNGEDPDLYACWGQTLPTGGGDPLEEPDDTDSSGHGTERDSDATKSGKNSDLDDQACSDGDNEDVEEDEHDNSEWDDDNDEVRYFSHSATPKKGGNHGNHGPPPRDYYT